MDNQKEFYRLWFEYLKRSDDYREYCMWLRERQRDATCPIPEKFRKDEQGHTHKFVGVFWESNDVHRFPFGVWWEWKEKRLLHIKKRNNGAHPYGPVQDWLNGWASLKADLDYAIDSFKESEGREPTAHEMKKHFLQIVTDMSNSYHNLFLRITLTTKPQKILEGVKGILASSEIKEKLSSGRKWAECLYRKPTVKPRLDDLQKYLKVYDMWKEKVQNRQPGDPGGWAEIIQHFEPGRTASNDADRRVYLRYKKNAVTIISNVERGDFPGTY